MHAACAGCRLYLAACTHLQELLAKTSSLGRTPAQGRLLLSNWWILLLGASFQYVHGAFTAVAYHMHEPREMLKDLGFMLLPVRARGCTDNDSRGMP